MPHRGSAHGPPPATGLRSSRRREASTAGTAGTASTASTAGTARSFPRLRRSTPAFTVWRSSVGWRPRLAATLLTLVCWSAASDSRALAQLPAPRLDALFPPVLQRGESIQLRVTAGQNLDLPQRWLFSDDRLQAASVLAKADDPYALEPAVVPDQLLVSVAADTPLGVVHIWCGSRFGISNPRPLLIVDAPVAFDLRASADPATAPEWPLDRWLVGHCSAQAVDHWRLPAERATDLSIRAHIAQLDSQLSPVLELVTEDGRLIATERGGRGSDLRLSVPVTPADPLLLRIRDNTYLGGPTFAYALSAESLPERAEQASHASDINSGGEAPIRTAETEAGGLDRPWQVPAVVHGRLGGPDQIEELHWVSPQAGRVVIDVVSERAGEATDPLMLVQLGRQDESGGWSWHGDKMVDDLDPLPELLGLRRHRDPLAVIDAAAGQRFRVRLRNKDRKSVV